MDAGALPEFYDPARVADLFLPRHGEVAAQAQAWRERHDVASASDDETRIAVFGIDCQVGFCTPGASLFVPGAVEDMQRGCAFILEHLAKITTLVFSLDTHRAYQIFHPAFWTDADGNPPAPMTPITLADVESGRWRPLRNADQVHAYCAQLEASGKYVLTIWPYHTLLGSPDHALVPALFEVAHFHSIARDTQTHFETKGEHPLTENYSVLEPEVKALGEASVGAFNDALMGLLLEHDRVYVWGEASSHCVAATLQSMIDRLQATRPELLARIHVLTDCTSPVSPVLGPDGAPLPGLDFPAIAAERFAAFEAAGVRMVTSGDGIEG